MENIRASEIRTYYKRTFFGFSRFLVVVLTFVTALEFFAHIWVNSAITDLANYNLAAVIVSLVFSVLMFFIFLSKAKWPQLVLTSVYIILNILILTKVLDVGAMAIRVYEANEAAREAAGISESSSADLIPSINTFINIGKNFESLDSAVLYILKLFAFFYTFVYAVFGIKSLKSVCSESLNDAIRVTLGDIKADPANPKNAAKKFMKKLHKLGRKEKWVDYCHELGVKCILDDPSQNEKYFVDGESEFKGNFLIFFLLNLLWNLLNIITLGIMVPFTTAWKYKFLAEHSVYSGKKVVFDGKGIQLLGRWLLWELLSIVTLGIYAFFMAVELKKWITKHQHFEGEEGTDSMYTGSAFGRGFMILGLKFIQGLSLGLATPYVENTIVRYDMEHTVISGQQLIFGGSALKLLGRFMLWVLFTCITIGVYAILVMPLNMTKYSVSQSRIRDMSYDPESDPR